MKGCEKVATVDDGWKVIVNVSASDGSIRPIILVDSDSADEAAITALYTAWKTDFAAVSDGAIKSWSISHDFHDDAFALPTSPAAERGEYAILVTSIDGDATKSAVINLPFAKDTIGVVYLDTTGPNRNIVKTNSTELAAYLDNFEAAAFEISDGEHSAGNILRGKRSGT
jgi:hypothetical protein